MFKCAVTLVVPTSILFSVTELANRVVYIRQHSAGKVKVKIIVSKFTLELLREMFDESSIYEVEYGGYTYE